jgi:DNA-directed RNA polymerase specialized sigma24 family protein
MGTLQAVRSADSMHGEYKVPGGKLVVVDLAVRDGQLHGVQVSGDFFIEPDSALETINQALHGLPADGGQAVIVQALEGALQADVQLYGITVEGVAVAVQRALAQGPQA